MVVNRILPHHDPHFFSLTLASSFAVIMPCVPKFRRIVCSSNKAHQDYDLRQNNDSHQNRTRLYLAYSSCSSFVPHTESHLGNFCLSSHTFYEKPLPLNSWDHSLRRSFSPCSSIFILFQFFLLLLVEDERGLGFGGELGPAMRGLYRQLTYYSSLFFLSLFLLCVCPYECCVLGEGFVIRMLWQRHHSSSFDLLTEVARPKSEYKQRLSLGLLHRPPVEKIKTSYFSYCWARIFFFASLKRLR